MPQILVCRWNCRSPTQNVERYDNKAKTGIKKMNGLNIQGRLSYIDGFVLLDLFKKILSLKFSNCLK